MNILLIVPNIEGRVGSPNLNMAALATFINECSSHRAEIVDLTFHKENWQHQLHVRLDGHHYDLVGFSVMTFDVLQSLRIARFIKQTWNLPIIFGGVHVILDPEDVIRHPEVDIICTGEGEFALREILDQGLNCHGIAGIWFKEHGTVVRNAARPLLENLDILPFPDWSQYDLETYFLFNNNHLTLMSGRGCPYSCTYCSNHILKKTMTGKYVRQRSVESVLDEVQTAIDRYASRGFKYIYFIDDIFILNRKWTLEFCRQYIARGYHRKIRFTCSVRANLVTEEVIRALKDAGCYQVGMGIEAADDAIRNDVYKRRMSREQIDRAVDIIKRSGLLLSCQFIIGAPFETIEMMEASLELARKIDADTIMFSILMPLPGTEIKDLCVKENLIEKEQLERSQVMYSTPVIRSKHATLQEIHALYGRMRRYQIRKYLTRGLQLKGLRFLWDLLVFLVYLKPKYKLEIQNAFKVTVNRYVLEKLQ
ncbi:MAG: radical SAM protein [Magnetococcales bacterium]|nr:radical SAM protein [Magnetococcales bacterium]